MYRVSSLVLCFYSLYTCLLRVFLYNISSYLSVFVFHVLITKSSNVSPHVPTISGTYLIFSLTLAPPALAFITYNFYPDLLNPRFFGRLRSYFIPVCLTLFGSVRGQARRVHSVFRVAPAHDQVCGRHVGRFGEGVHGWQVRRDSDPQA